MLAEALTALAVSGGTAVVQAAGTDVWVNLRGRLAGVLGRGDERREQAELERLDQTAAELEASTQEEVSLVQARHAGMWQSRLEVWFESLNDEERADAVVEIRRLLQVEGAADAESSAPSAWYGDVHMSPHASGNSRIYQVGQGNMHIGDS